MFTSKRYVRTTLLGTGACLTLASFALPLTAFAEEETWPSGQATKPTAPSPESVNPKQDMKTNAGVGSKVAYAERGVIELGGSLAFATANGVTSLAVEPSAGYFLLDNVELSGVLSVRHISVAGENANQVSLVVEPSLHFPLNDGLFVFGGLGIGAALYDTSATSVDVGLAVAPRGGVQVLVGRSGLLNFAARYSAVLSSLDGQVATGGGQTVLAIQNQFDILGGYTVMF